MERHELEAWLGPALDDLTSEQIDRLAAEANRLSERYDDDHLNEWNAAMSAAVQYVLGETTVEDAGHRLTAARRTEAETYAASQQVAVMAVTDGMSEEKAAQAAGISRMIVRRALGKPWR